MKIVTFLTLMTVSYVQSDDEKVMRVQVFATRDCNITVTADHIVHTLLLYRNSLNTFIHPTSQHIDEENLALTVRVDGSNDLPQTVLLALDFSYSSKTVNFTNFSVTFIGNNDFGEYQFRTNCMFIVLMILSGIFYIYLLFSFVMHDCIRWTKKEFDNLNKFMDAHTDTSIVAEMKKKMVEMKKKVVEMKKQKVEAGKKKTAINKKKAAIRKKKAEIKKLKAKTSKKTTEMNKTTEMQKQEDVMKKLKAMARKKKAEIKKKLAETSKKTTEMNKTTEMQKQEAVMKKLKAMARKKKDEIKKKLAEIKKQEAEMKKLRAMARKKNKMLRNDIVFVAK